MEELRTFKPRNAVWKRHDLVLSFSSYYVVETSYCYVQMPLLLHCWHLHCQRLQSINVSSSVQSISTWSSPCQLNIRASKIWLIVLSLRSFHKHSFLSSQTPGKLRVSLNFPWRSVVTQSNHEASQSFPALFLEMLLFFHSFPIARIHLY